MNDDRSRGTPADGQEETPTVDRNPVRMRSARITTIVGGRPAGDPSTPGAFPAGIEQVLTLAALDDGFRASLREDRGAAIRDRGIELTPTETQMLGAMPAAVLERAIDQVLVPNTSRRGFIKVASVTAVAMLGGAGLVRYVSGKVQASYGSRPDAEAEALRGLQTLGIRPDEGMPKGIRPDLPAASDDRQTRGIRPDAPPQGRAPGDYWIRLAEHTALMYVPPLSPEGATPLLLVFHDAGKTVLDAMRAWRKDTLAGRPLVVGVKWSGQSDDVEKVATATGRMLDDLASDYQVTLGTPIVAVGVGRGATIALQAALFVEKRFTAAIAVDGALPVGWDKRKLVDPKGTAVWAAVGPESPVAAYLDAQIPALGKLGLKTRLVKTVGSSASDVGAAAPAWEWVSTAPKQK